MNSVSDMAAASDSKTYSIDSNSAATNTLTAQRLFQKMFNFIICVCHILWWRWRFGEFGWRSRVGRCDMLTNPKAVSIGRKVLIRKGARLEAVGPWDGRTPKITIGDGTAIQFYFHCGSAKSVSIGKNVLISGRVFISDHDHCYKDVQFAPVDCKRLDVKPIVIEDGCWLGEGCAILKGVTVHSRAVVGANAVVTKDVPAGAIVAGVPAKVIGNAISL
jgi:acetyltransferase-like isoleucine patch superfamily enzyme